SSQYTLDVVSGQFHAAPSKTVGHGAGKRGFATPQQSAQRLVSWSREARPIAVSERCRPLPARLLAYFLLRGFWGSMGPRPRVKVIRRGEPRRPTFRLRVARRATGSAAYQIARAGNPRAQARNARPILGVPLLLLAVAYTGFLSDSWLLRIP